MHCLFIPPNIPFFQKQDGCVDCPYGFYSFDGQDCYVCPEGATCGGGPALIASMDNWWRSSNTSGEGGVEWGGVEGCWWVFVGLRWWCMVSGKLLLWVGASFIVVGRGF